MQLPQIVKKNKAAFGVGGVLMAALIGWLAFGYFGIQAAFIDDVVDESGPVFTVTPDDESTTDTTAPAASDETPEDDMSEDAMSDDAMSDDEMSDGEMSDGEMSDGEADEEPAADEMADEEPSEIVTILDGDFTSLNNYSVSGDALVLNNGTEQRFLRFENFDSDNGPDLKVYLRSADGEFISLGDLSGNIGNQNYEIPVDVDLSVFDTVQIWCERFSRGFGEATLSPA